MSLSKGLSSFRGVGFTIMKWFTFFMIVSIISICATVYFLLEKSLRKSDHDIISNKSQIISKYLENNSTADGFESLKFILSSEEDVYVGILSNGGVLLFSILPDNLLQEGELEYVVKNSQANLHVGWRSFLSEAGRAEVDRDTRFQLWLMDLGYKDLVYFLEEDIFEVKTIKLSDGSWLQVGKNAVKREAKLMKVRNTAYVIFVAFVILSLFLSYLLSKVILRPVREMISTIDRIERGELDSQVKLTGSDDEIDQLARRFNQLMRSNHKLITAMKDTLDNVAHDLRTPLTRIMNSAEEAFEADNLEAFKNALEDTMENSQRIKTLLNTIMDLSEAENGLMYLKQEKFEILEVFEQVTNLYLPLLEDGNIFIKIHSENPVEVFGDSIRLGQAVTNLVDNAIKYSPSGGTIHLSAKIVDQEVFICVQDQGVGIPFEEQSRIWERLYRGDQSRSTTGLGIGLSMVKAIVMAHHGRVAVANNVLNGVTFCIILPVKDS